MKKPRARDLGIPLDGTPGNYNAITDVGCIAVGHTTVIESDHIRTGVTAVLPCGLKNPASKVPAAVFSLNGNGEMTGSHWVEESGFLEGPILITNTHSVGVCRDSIIEWINQRYDRTDEDYYFYLPMVAETYDGMLNDINGHHITKEHAFAALNTAENGHVAEGCVGGGTGMITHEFKGGIGTASRIITINGNIYHVGALVQSNYGDRHQLSIAGVPVGKEITDLMPTYKKRKDGSIIIILATDAPLLPHQIKRLARRGSMGLARLGSVAQNSSGDIFMAFSTALPQVHHQIETWHALDNDDMDPLFQAAVESVEESILNALVAADTMTGINGNIVHAIPHEALRRILQKYNRLNSGK